MQRNEAIKRISAVTMMMLLSFTVISASASNGNGYNIRVTALVASTQDVNGIDADNNSVEWDWILSGPLRFNIKTMPNGELRGWITSNITMVRTDGTHLHFMIFRDLKIGDITQTSNTIRIEGTIDVYGQHPGREPTLALQGRGDDVPIAIEIRNNTILSIIWLDDGRWPDIDGYDYNGNNMPPHDNIAEHFGNEPIYSVIKFMKTR